MIKDLIKAKGEEISVLDKSDKLEYLIDLAKDHGDLDFQDKTNENINISFLCP
ncbi:MAG: hypothetical protein VW910_03135 [Pelagibacteraceae bacterium]